MCFVIAVCNFVIPKGEIRRIKRLGVHLVMSVWSAFSFVWLYFMIGVISPGEIEIWEGVLTLVFFPLAVISAYIAHKSGAKPSAITYRVGDNGIIVETTSDSVSDQIHLKQFPEELESEDVHQFEDERRRFLSHLQTLRHAHPDLDVPELELMAAAELFEKGTISRAFHRMTVATKLTGLQSIQVRQKSHRNDLLNLSRPPVSSSPSHVTKILFNPGHYTVSETVGILRAVVMRENGDLKRSVLVDYMTEDGGAVAGKGYVSVKGTICFRPEETQQEIQIKINDYVVSGVNNHHLYIRLYNARFAHQEVETSTEDSQEQSNASIALATPSIATVF